MARAEFTWNGNATRRQVDAAVKAAFDETMILCVGSAVSRVHVITGVLQGSIDFTPARQDGDRIVGEWGSYDVNYAVYEEILHPYLRPAADAHYPGIQRRIARRLS